MNFTILRIKRLVYTISHFTNWRHSLTYTITKWLGFWIADNQKLDLFEWFWRKILRQPLMYCGNNLIIYNGKRFKITRN